jgi:GNAT superfamily N-acetyltransferase
MSEYFIRPAVLADAQVIFTFISSLLRGVDPESHYLYVEKNMMPPIQEYLTKDCGVYIFICEDESGAAQGVITLNECKAIYAFGAFGEISELYVMDNMRSKGLGEQLIRYAETFAKSKGWAQIEVGAPDVPKWQRTVDFYHRCGYETVGPRLYKWINKPT